MNELAAMWVKNCGFAYIDILGNKYSFGWQKQ